MNHNKTDLQIVREVAEEAGYKWPETATISEQAEDAAKLARDDEIINQILVFAGVRERSRDDEIVDAVLSLSDGRR